jgi:ABC-2 type transport system ATP-binding protein
VSETISRALATLPVKDLTVENAPLEEVMSELFERSRRSAAPAGNGKPS